MRGHPGHSQPHDVDQKEPAPTPSPQSKGLAEVEQGILVVEDVSIEPVAVEQATCDAEKDPSVAVGGRVPSHQYSEDRERKRWEQPEDLVPPRPHAAVYHASPPVDTQHSSRLIQRQFRKDECLATEKPRSAVHHYGLDPTESHDPRRSCSTALSATLSGRDA